MWTEHFLAALMFCNVFVFILVNIYFANCSSVTLFMLILLLFLILQGNFLLFRHHLVPAASQDHNLVYSTSVIMTFKLISSDFPAGFEGLILLYITSSISALYSHQWWFTIQSASTVELMSYSNHIQLNQLIFVLTSLACYKAISRNFSRNVCVSALDERLVFRCRRASVTGSDGL